MDCDCAPVIADDLEAEAEYWIPNQPHEAHDLIPPCLEEDLPEGWTMEKWQKACKLAAAAPELLDIAQTIKNQFWQAGIQPVQDSNDPAEALLFKVDAVLAKVTAE